MAIQAAPEPKNVTELRSFLGMINYYGRFLPKLALRLAPLYQLLRQNVRWQWKGERKEAFRRAKEALLSIRVMIHFDPRKEVIVACDASPYGVGAVLSHRLNDGTELSIVFAFRSLAEAERRYAQIDREPLALLFGVKKFHQYLSGRAFTILTHHKPLVSSLEENKGVPLMASGRIQRWAIMLSSYQYKLRYRPGTTNANADALSRLPLTVKQEVTEDLSESVLSLHILEMTPARAITTVQLRQFTDRDGQLAIVRHYVLSGWPREVNSELRHYWNRRHELSVLGGCVLLGVSSNYTSEGVAEGVGGTTCGSPGGIWNEKPSKKLHFVAGIGC